MQIAIDSSYPCAKSILSTPILHTPRTNEREEPPSRQKSDANGNEPFRLTLCASVPKFSMTISRVFGGGGTSQCHDMQLAVEKRAGPRE